MPRFTALAMPMKVIGLTGGMGVGKGEVASVLHSLGASVIDADEEGHRAYQRDTEGWRRVLELFGPQVLGEDGEVDRQRLGRLVFGDPEALGSLNAAVHPLIRGAVDQRLQQWRNDGRAVAVVAAAILLEAGWRDLVDEVWVVWAPLEAVVSRVKHQRGLTQAEVLQRLQSQTSGEWKIKQADVTIDNSGTLDELRQKVILLWRERINPQEE